MRHRYETWTGPFTEAMSAVEASLHRAARDALDGHVADALRAAAGAGRDSPGDRPRSLARVVGAALGAAWLVVALALVVTAMGPLDLRTTAARVLGGSILIASGLTLLVVVRPVRAPMVRSGVKGAIYAELLRDAMPVEISGTLERPWREAIDRTLTPATASALSRIAGSIASAGLITMTVGFGFMFLGVDGTSAPPAAVALVLAAIAMCFVALALGTVDRLRMRRGRSARR